MLQTKVTITSAEWKALAATPKQIIPTPGANKFIVTIAATLCLKYNSIPYVNPSGSPPTICIGTPPGSSFTASYAVGDVAYAADLTDLLTSPFTGNDDTANAADKPLFLYNPGPLEYTTGDSDWLLTVDYAIVDTT